MMYKELTLLAALALVACKDEKASAQVQVHSQPTLSSSSALQSSSSVQPMVFEQPKLQGKFGQQRLVLGATAEQALKNFDPQFKIWQNHDYLPSLFVLSEYETVTAAELQKRAPFAIVMDFNGDQKNDLVVQGRNATLQRYLVLMSTPAGYQVQVLKDQDGIAMENDLQNAKVDDWEEGNKTYGLSCYLEKTDGMKTDFAITCAQLGDSTGEAFNDPSWADFTYKKGKWLRRDAEV